MSCERCEHLHGCRRQCMDLPEGCTCALCIHINRCAAIFGVKPENTQCDFEPVRLSRLTDWRRAMPEYPYTEPKQTLHGGRQSICPKCFHYKVCRGTANQPCIECNQFASTADVRPAAHGKWEEKAEYCGDDVSGFTEKRYYCSLCHSEALVTPFLLYDLSNYCPNCGAIMDEEGKT